MEKYFFVTASGDKFSPKYRVLVFDLELHRYLTFGEFPSDRVRFEIEGTDLNEPDFVLTSISRLMLISEEIVSKIKVDPDTLAPTELLLDGKTQRKKYFRVKYEKNIVPKEIHNFESEPFQLNRFGYEETIYISKEPFNNLTPKIDTSQINTEIPYMVIDGLKGNLVIKESLLKLIESDLKNYRYFEVSLMNKLDYRYNALKSSSKLLSLFKGQDMVFTGYQKAAKEIYVKNKAQLKMGIIKDTNIKSAYLDGEDFLIWDTFLDTAIQLNPKEQERIKIA